MIEYETSVVGDQESTGGERTTEGMCVKGGEAVGRSYWPGRGDKTETVAGTHRQTSRGRNHNESIHDMCRLIGSGNVGGPRRDNICGATDSMVAGGREYARERRKHDKTG